MAPPGIFACAPAAKALVALILIENSPRILPFWDALSQHYLPTLLGTIRVTNPVLPIPVLWLTTAPVGDDPASLRAPPPRQYNQLPELKFSLSPDNKITSRIISRATELMLEAATQFRGGPVSFHLFIVAASSPTQGAWGVSVTMPTQIGQSEWRLLGQRIAQLGMHCHMILPTSQDMSAMNELFNTSLHLQGHTQVPPWFPTSPDHTFLLSGDPSSPARSHPGSPLAPPDTSTIDSAPLADPQQHPLHAVPRPPVLRHQSFPQDVQSAPSPPGQGTSTPSLVTSLQKVHGLSRKKLYGAQSPRQPFVREEPVRSKYKSTPTPLSIPVGSQPLHISDDARVLAKSKVERTRRADRPPHIADASSSSSGRKSPWSQFASSDIGSSPSSPTTSLSSHHTTSPTIPPYPDLAAYPTSPPSTATFSPDILSSVPIPDTNFSSSLCDSSGGYLSPPFLPVSSQGPVWTPVSKPVARSAGAPTASRRHSQELPYGSHTQSLSAMSGKYRLETVSTDPRPTPKSVQRVKDAGDVPFIFSPELEAATAAKLKAALQSTSPVSSSSSTMNHFSVFTSGNQPNYAASEDAYAAPALAPPDYDPMQDACPTGLVNGNIHCGDGEPHPRFVGSTSSSSLQGWAG